MGSFRRTGFSYFSCEFMTMGTSHLRRLTPIAPLAALFLAAAAPAWAQGAGKEIDHSARISTVEKRLAQEPTQINVQDRPELRTGDEPKIKAKIGRASGREGRETSRG